MNLLQKIPSHFETSRFLHAEDLGKLKLAQTKDPHTEVDCNTVQFYSALLATDITKMDRSAHPYFNRKKFPRPHPQPLSKFQLTSYMLRNCLVSKCPSLHPQEIPISSVGEHGYFLELHTQIKIILFERRYGAKVRNSRLLSSFTNEHSILMNITSPMVPSATVGFFRHLRHSIFYQLRLLDA